MISKLKWVIACAIAVAWITETAEAAEGNRNFHVVNRLRVELDDNVQSAQTNKKDSIKIIEQLDLSYNVNVENTFLSLRYQPSFVWWDDRPQDDTDVHHAFDGSLNHIFSPRTSISFRDTLRFAERPDTIDRGSVIRQDNDFLYNSFVGSLSYLVAAETRLETAGRVVSLDYDDAAAAAIRDYDIYVGGLTLRQTYSPETSVLGEFRWEELQYEQAGRDSSTLFLGGGVEHTLSPTLLTSVRAGYEGREFDDTIKSRTDSPYLDLSLTMLPSQSTRLSSGVAFSQYESDISPFASSKRTRVFASVAHDVSARVAAFLTGAFTNNEYDRTETVTGDVPDGDEQWWQFSARANYKINRNNLIDLSYQFTDVESDLRTDFDRNRVSVGWVLSI
jgi:hypothetical protein